MILLLNFSGIDYISWLLCKPTDLISLAPSLG